MVWVADRGCQSEQNAAICSAPAGAPIRGEKPRGNDKEAKAAVSRQGAYRTVAGTLRVKGVIIDDGAIAAARSRCAVGCLTAVVLTSMTALSDSSSVPQMARRITERGRRWRSPASPLELPEQALELMEIGQQAAIAAARKFIDTVDRATPLQGEGASARQGVIDSERSRWPVGSWIRSTLFVRSVVRAAATPLGASDGGSEDAWVTRSSSVAGRSPCEVLVGSRVRRGLAARRARAMSAGVWTAAGDDRAA